MLSYAFKILNKQGYKKVATEKFENFADLCSAILINGTSSLIKKGLAREYVLKTETTAAVKGKIDISSSIKEQSMIKRRLVCEYDEFSENSYMNRIIKTTMLKLLHADSTQAGISHKACTYAVHPENPSFRLCRPTVSEAVR